MKGRVIALDTIDGRQAAALIEDGQLADLLIETDGPPMPGTIFRAIVDRPLKGQGALILRLPDGMSGFLRGTTGLRPGQAVLVQVTGLAEDGKAVPVTAKVLFKSRYAIVTPDAPGLNISRRLRDEDRRAALMEIAGAAMDGSPMGLILRSSAETGDDAAIADDIADMRGIAEQVLADADGPAERLLDGPGPHETAWRDWPDANQTDSDPGSFDRHGVRDLIEALTSARIRLDGGGHAYIEPTRALVAVDVNTGGDTSAAAGLKANIALARDLPRQLRLRGLGGQITVDFAPMPKKDRRTLETVLRAAFKADPVETALAGWTPLGCFELQRKRERLPLDLKGLT